MMYNSQEVSILLSEKDKKISVLVDELLRVDKLLDSLQQHTTKRAWEYIKEQRKRIKDALAKVED